MERLETLVERLSSSNAEKGGGACSSSSSVRRAKTGMRVASLHGLLLVASYVV